MKGDADASALLNFPLSVIMKEYTPADEDVSYAQDFLARRISSENVYRSGLADILKTYAYKIILIGYSYNIVPKEFEFSRNPSFEAAVDALLQEMLDEIYNLLIEQISALVDDDDDVELILAYFKQLGNGTLDVYGQLEAYIERYKKEMEAFIAAGLIIGYTALKTLSEYTSNMKTPWTDKMITAAFNVPGVKAERLRNRGVSYGRGRSNVSATLMETIGVGSIATSWWQFDGAEMMRDGAIGYVQLRGSNYPCEICDAEVGFHPIEDAEFGYPHVHCQCYRVPVYGDERDMKFGNLNNGML
jgi:hypothetical protein